MKRIKQPLTGQQREEWLDLRISLCHEATKEIKKFNEWASELYENVHPLPSVTASVHNRDESYAR